MLFPLSNGELRHRERATEVRRELQSPEGSSLHSAWGQVGLSARSSQATAQSGCAPLQKAIKKRCARGVYKTTPQGV